VVELQRISKQDLFEVRQRDCYLRGHAYSLEVKRSRISIRSNFCIQRTVKHWNSVPEHVVSASFVNCFKIAWIRVHSGAFKSYSLLT